VRNLKSERQKEAHARARMSQNMIYYFTLRDAVCLVSVFVTRYLPRTVRSAFAFYALAPRQMPPRANMPVSPTALFLPQECAVIEYIHYEMMASDADALRLASLRHGCYRHIFALR